jgi:periplasmic protein TonB
MFNNLIESSSHGRELRRRGSFMLFTTASYALLFAIVGVISIYAYDAHMKDQNLEIVTLLPPIVAAPPEREPPAERPDSSRNNRPNQAFDERRVFVAPIDRVERPPDSVSTDPNPFPPVRDNVLTISSNRDVNAEDPGGSNRGSGRTTLDTESNRIITEVEPPPAPTPKPAPKVVSKGVITSEAISLPKPAYPPIAQQTRTQGPVSIQVLIDESGKVISAKVISGNPLLTAAAVRAAYQARFSPTMLGDQAVKVSGVITYNFILQQ